MRLVAVLAILAACSSAPIRVETPPKPPTPSEPTPGLPGAPTATIHKPRGLIESPHGGPIHVLAASPDGNVVLSADELGGTRLWPSLDGTHEPRVVDMPMARMLAIGRRTDGFTAVGLDQVGGLYIAKLDATGRTLSHATIPPDPPFTGMAMTPLGLLAWRADQTIVLLDSDGATTAKLATEPGHRIIAIAVAGKRAVALLESDKKRARWLTLEPTLAWGGSLLIDSAVASGTDIALSPNGYRLAALSRTDRDTKVVVIEIATNKDYGPGAVPSINAEVAFIDDDHVAVGGFDALAWIDLTATKPTVTALGRGAVTGRLPARAMLATGGGRAITATNGELVLSTPKGQEFLGYEAMSPRVAQVAPNGQLLVGINVSFWLLDSQLRVASTPSFTVSDGLVVGEVQWLGGNDWLVESTKAATAQTQIAIFDAATGTETVVRTGLKESHILMYEPSTKLATLSGTNSEVARFDAGKRRLDQLLAHAQSSPYEWVLFVPISPKLARGNSLLQITMRDRPTIKWLRDASSLDKPSASVTIPGSYAGADAAGHVFVWRHTPASALELVVLMDGKPIGTLPNDGPVALWPDPTGTRLVEISQRAVRLFQVDGKQLWAQQIATAQEALWLTDGTIAITSAGGIARLDPATGGVITARCGWRFELASKPHPPTPQLEPLCTQLGR